MRRLPVFLLFFALLSGAALSGEPQVCPIDGCPPASAAKLKTPADDILKLAAELKTKETALNEATAAVTKDQEALTRDVATQASAQAACDEIKAKIKAILDGVPPNPPPPVPPPVPPPDPPPPVPPPTAGVSLLMVGRSVGCAPCETMKGIFAEVAKAGYAVQIVYVDKDAGAQEKWKPIVVPTLVMLVNGERVADTTGVLSAAQVRNWIDETKTWAENRKGGK